MKKVGRGTRWASSVSEEAKGGVAHLRAALESSQRRGAAAGWWWQLAIERLGEDKAGRLLGRVATWVKGQEGCGER
jgi:hypothetical protein